MGLGQRGAFALRAEIKMRSAVFEIEIESEFLRHDLEVIHVHLRRELLAGVRTNGLRTFGARFAINGDPELGGPLDDVEEFPERNPDQEQDDRDRVGHRHERIVLAVHEVVVPRQPEPGDGNRQQQDQREPVAFERLERDLAEVGQPAPHEDQHPGDHHPRAPIEDVEGVVGDEAVERKLHDLEPEDEHFVGVDAALFQPEVNPPEGQRDRDGKRDHAAPRHEEVAPEPAPPAMRDEALEWEVRDEMLHQLPAVGEGLAAEKQLKRAFEKAPSRRPLKPHDIAIDNRKCREQRADKIRHQRRIEVLQIA